MNTVVPSQPVQVDDVNEYPRENADGRFRGAQLSAILTHTPFMMFGNFANVTMLVALISVPHLQTAIYLWAASVAALAAVAMRSWIGWHRQGRKIRSASARAISRANVNAAILGLLWAFVPIMIYPAVHGSEKTLIAVIMFGMICGGAFALSAIPSTMHAYVVPLIAGSTIGLLHVGGMQDFYLLVLLSVFTIIVFRSGNSHGRLFEANIRDRDKLAEQASIISILLRDFEDGTSDWLWETDRANRLTRGMDRFSDLLDSGQQLVASKSITDLLGGAPCPELSVSFGESFVSAVERRKPFRDFKLRITRGNRTCWISLSGKPVHDEQGNFTGFRGVASDITDAQEYEQRIAYLAHHDPLTGLVNRSRFTATLNAMLNSNTPNASGWCVLYLDLDGFKLINEQMGQRAGDRLLVKVGARLRQETGEDDIVARLGGDEFAILSTGAKTLDSVSALAERIIESLDKPFEIEESEVSVGVSIGIAFSGKDGKTAESLLNSADLAMFRAKEAGRNSYRIFELEMDAIVREKRLLVKELQSAMTQDEFDLWFQPLVDALSRKTTGFEALVRWQHPKRGMVSPDHFISLAENSGLIIQLGDWILENACQKATHWPEHLSVAVNLSPQQFRDRHIVTKVHEVLATTGLDPKRLELEITEGLFIHNTEEVIDCLGELKELGISIALDDFGTGYSSLSYLLKFPFDKLKIDRTFIETVSHDPLAQDVLETIIALGRIMDLEITIEGVESYDQVEFLKQLDCTYFQGFLFGRPIAGSDLPAYLLKETAETISSARSESTKAVASA